MWFRALSVYLYPLIILLIALILLLSKINSSNSGHIQVDTNRPPFDSQLNPTWLIHMSDIHISHCQNASEIRLRKCMTLFNTTIHPKLVVFTGDLCDSYNPCKKPGQTEPIEQQWIQYSTILNETGFNRSNIVEIYGNHDMFGILNFDPFVQPAARYTMRNQSDFYTFVNENEDVRVIGFVPQDFPTAHGPLNFVATLRKKMLDSLEKRLNEPTNSQYTFVGDHFPQEVIANFDSCKSSSGKTLSTLLEEHNVIAFLTGHTHPNKNEVRHFGKKSVELTSMATKINDGFNLITVDNGEMNYQRFDQNQNEDFAMITYPTPSHLATSIRQDSDKDIRVLSFSPSTTKSFIVSIDGKEEGSLNFTRYVDADQTIALYSRPTSLARGKHTLMVSGDMNASVEFYVNQETEKYKESRVLNINLWWVTYLIIALGVDILLTIFFMWMPLKIPSKTWQKILQGPIFVGSSISKLSLPMKIFMTFLALYPLCLPLSFFRTEGEIGIMWMHGYVSIGKNRTDTFALALALVYYVTIYLISVDVSFITVSDKTLSIIADTIIDIFLLIMEIYIWYTFGCDSGYPYYWLASVYLIIPLVEIPIFIWANMRRKMDRFESPPILQVKYNETSDLLTTV